MTTIIATRTALYADTLCTSTSIFNVTKLARIGESIYGGAGDFEEIQFFLEWRRGKEKPEFPDTADFYVIELNKKGICLWGTRLSPMYLKDKIYAIGSGAQFALGAIAYGATPQEAIKIAAKYDTGTRAPFEIMEL